MHLEHLRIQRFRLLQDAALELAPGVNLLFGGNAQGKTTVLEAIGYLSTGRSFRAQRDREVIAQEAPVSDAPAFASVEARLLRGLPPDATWHDVRLTIEKAQKTVWLDQKSLRTLTELWGLMPTVLFVPADLQLVQGAPTLRRAVMDALLGQMDPAYLRVLIAWARALQNRNALLRRGVGSSDPQYPAFEDAMARHGARVLRSRADLLRHLSADAAAPMTALTAGREALTLHYEPAFPSGASLEAEDLLAADQEVLTRQLAAHWAKTRHGDLERGVTRDGPHRDDFRFAIDGRDARTYASQGQTRSCVLALRLAELALLERLGGLRPLLLLDDILGELDRGRAEHFLHLVAETQVQTILTATDAAAVTSALPVQRQFEVAAGQIRPVEP